MNLLIDTHVLIWMATDSYRLPEATRALIQDNENAVFVSAVTAWEISIKVNLGKLDEAGELEKNLPDDLKIFRFFEAPVTVAHARRGGRLPPHHRDPFDRLLAGQSLVDNYGLVSADRVFDLYGVERIWRSQNTPSPAGLHET